MPLVEYLESAELLSSLCITESLESQSRPFRVTDITVQALWSHCCHLPGLVDSPEVCLGRSESLELPSRPGLTKSLELPPLQSHLRYGPGLKETLESLSRP